MKIRSLLVIAVLATAILCSAGAVNAQTPTVQGLMNQIAQLQAQLSSQPAGSVGNLMLQIQILQLQLQLLQLQSATPTRPSISIVSPVANAQLMQGQTYNISWTSSGINTMSINILNQGTAGNWASIVENIPASSGSYSWTVPSAMTPGNYAIYFSDNDSGYTNIPNTIAGYTNLSFNNGSISVIAATPNQPSITVTSPASGVQWAQGSTQNIA
ncbi:MAG: Ser-Thr-rich GPI-anchored membrane family protein, partial [Candidatus Staskawiczbacteria bacterium]